MLSGSHGARGKSDRFSEQRPPRARARQGVEAADPLLQKVEHAIRIIDDKMKREGRDQHLASAQETFDAGKSSFFRKSLDWQGVVSTKGKISVAYACECLIEQIY